MKHKLGLITLAAIILLQMSMFALPASAAESEFYRMDFNELVPEGDGHWQNFPYPDQLTWRFSLMYRPGLDPVAENYRPYYQLKEGADMGVPDPAGNKVMEMRYPGDGHVEEHGLRLFRMNERYTTQGISMGDTFAVEFRAKFSADTSLKLIAFPLPYKTEAEPYEESGVLMEVPYDQRPNDWATYRFVFDRQTMTEYLFIDDTLSAAQAIPSEQLWTGGFNGLYLIHSSWGQNLADGVVRSMYVDYLRVYMTDDRSMLEPKLSGITIGGLTAGEGEQELTGIPTSATEAALSFNCQVDESLMTTEHIRLTGADGDIPIEIRKDSEYHYTAVFSEPLAYGAQYTLSVDSLTANDGSPIANTPVQLTFETIESEFMAEDVQFTQNDGNISVSMNATNYLPETVSATVLLAVYADGELLDYQHSELSLPAGGTEPVSVQAPCGEGADRAVAYVWNSLQEPYALSVPFETTIE